LLALRLLENRLTIWTKAVYSESSFEGLPADRDAGFSTVSTMLIIFGQKRCGKVDHVPGLFYVITEFFHVYYFPLIPLGSYLILDGGSSTQGTRISISFKSVLMGWFRALLVVGFFAGLLSAGVAAAELGAHKLSMEAILVPLMIAGLCALFYWLTKRSERAGYGRALTLAEQVGIPQEYVEKSFEPPTDSFEQYEHPDQYVS
jgi:hypothetical protein